jgi:hypothetical protein
LNRVLVAVGLATISCSMACAPLEQTDDAPAQPAAEATADPAKLLTSRPSTVITQVRISSILQVQDGCLVIGSTELHTVVWPAGTILSPDRRAVIIPGAPRPVAIGERLLASGGLIALSSPPMGMQAVALAHGCPGTLASVDLVEFEE